MVIGEIAPKNLAIARTIALARAEPLDADRGRFSASMLRTAARGRTAYSPAVILPQPVAVATIS